MSTSIWFQTLDEAQCRLLEESDPLPRTAEIAVVGAGLIGLAAAYYLSAGGASGLCVLDRRAGLAEASGANAGGLWFAQQSPELGPLIPLAQASSRMYEELATEGGFDFGYRRPGLVELLPGEREWGEAEGVLAAVRRAGFRAARIDQAQLQGLEPALSHGPAGAIFYPEEGQLHPARLGAAWVRRLKHKNVRFCFGAEVRRLRPRIETSLGTLDAGVVLLAAGAWTPLVSRTLGWTPPIRPMRGQLLVTPPLPPLLRHTVIGRRYYYWQLPEGPVGGGGTVEDVGFERGVNPQDLARIREEMDALFPQLSGAPTACAWSGFRPYCEDLKPVIGRCPGEENLYVAAGHFKKGVMLAPVTGKILADLILTGRTDLPIQAFNPARFSAVATP